MKSSLRRLMNAGAGSQSPPVPYAAPGRYSLAMFAGQNAVETYLKTYGTHGTVFSIVRLLSNSVAQPKWSLYRKQSRDGRVRYTTADHGSDQRVEVVQHAALDLICCPNPWQTTFEFIEASQQHLELAGECFWILENKMGMPVSMWLISPARMDVIPSHDNYIQGYVYNSPQGEKIPLGVDEVIHTKTPNPLDSYRGIGPIQTILANIDAMRYATEYNRNFFLNDATPGGVIQVDKRLSDTEWDELVNRWRESHQGVARAHRVAVLENGAAWVAGGITQKDMEFVKLMEENRDLIREAWGIHKSMLGNSDDVNRANAQTAEEVFGAWHLVPRLDRLKNTFNSKLLPLFGSTGMGVEFDYENPLPDDREADNYELTAKSAAVQVLAAAGYDLHDVLEVVGLPDMGIADKPVQQTALPPAQQSGPGGQPANPPGELENFMETMRYSWNRAYMPEKAGRK